MALILFLALLRQLAAVQVALRKLMEVLVVLEEAGGFGIALLGLGLGGLERRGRDLLVVQVIPAHITLIRKHLVVVGVAAQVALELVLFPDITLKVMVAPDCVHP
jgi:hypothetical protein